MPTCDLKSHDTSDPLDFFFFILFDLLFFVFFEEIDIKVEQNYIFSFVFNKDSMISLWTKKLPGPLDHHYLSLFLLFFACNTLGQVRPMACRSYIQKLIPHIGNVFEPDKIIVIIIIIPYVFCLSLLATKK